LQQDGDEEEGMEGLVEGREWTGSTGEGRGGKWDSDGVGRG